MSMYRTDVVAGMAAQATDDYATMHHDIARTCDYLRGAVEALSELTGISTTPIYRAISDMTDDYDDAAAAAAFIIEHLE